MTRKITIHIHDHESSGADPTAEQYTDLANAIWMVLRTTPFNFAIEPDRRADTHAMDKAWEQYGEDASWNG